MRETVEERFWAKVDKSGTIEYPKCWIWIAGTIPYGYGMFWFRDKIRYAHRVVWILTKGEIPKGMHILHKCDNPPCVNPDHLDPGTHTDNMRDCLKKGRHAEANKTHCSQGHPYSGDNLYIVPSTGWRRCRKCKSIIMRKYHQRKKSINAE